MNTLRWEDVTIKYVVNGLINVSLVRIFWFFIPLYIVYLSIPLFSAVEEEKRKSVFVYISVVGFLLNVLIPFLAGFTYWIPDNGSLRLYVTMSYLLYMVVGWLLHTQETKKLYRIVLYILAILGLFCICLELIFCLCVMEM